jgi:SAM-dependent methyltransferase
MPMPMPRPSSSIAHAAAQPLKHALETPSPWFVGQAALIAPSASLLDVACGRGRHARFFAERGAHVTAVDRDATALQSLATIQNVATECRDLEGDAWPYAAETFDAAVVCNYLWRPTLAALLDTIKPGGVLLYETFMDGNERYGKPSRTDFLLRSNELLALTLARDGFRVLAFTEGPEHDVSGQPCAIKQKIAAIKR